MNIRDPRESQMIRLFATLAGLTVMLVLLFRLVLFAPVQESKVRDPATSVEIKNK